MSCGKLKSELVSSDVVPNKRVAKSMKKKQTKTRSGGYDWITTFSVLVEGQADPRTCGQQKYGPGCSHVGGLQLFSLLHLPLLQSSLRKVANA